MLFNLHRLFSLDGGVKNPRHLAWCRGFCFCIGHKKTRVKRVFVDFFGLLGYSYTQLLLSASATLPPDLLGLVGKIASYPVDAASARGQSNFLPLLVS